MPRPRPAAVEGRNRVVTNSNNNRALVIDHDRAGCVELDVCRALAVRLTVSVGFIAGCGVGAVCEVWFARRSLAVPAALALLASAIGLAVNRDGGGGS
jgi:hypothetical protein